MDPVIHLSEGQRSDMLLDLSSLTREERVVVQASINNERDFDRIAEALIIEHPRIHLRDSWRRAKGKGKDGSKRGDNSSARWFRGKGKGTNTNTGKSGTSAYYAKYEKQRREKEDEEKGEGLQSTSGSSTGHHTTEGTENIKEVTFTVLQKKKTKVVKFKRKD